MTDPAKVSYIDPAKVSYSNTVYGQEKVLGLHHHTGRQKLKKLKAKHRHVITYNLQGLSNAAIADILGCSQGWVGRVLRDPLAKEILSNFADDHKQELKSLLPHAVDVIRRSLGSDDPRVALTAADKFFKASGIYNQVEEASGQTAEDVIVRVLARVAENQTDIIKELSRPKPIKMIEGIAIRQTVNHEED